jgi:hypothetical protein
MTTTGYRNTLTISATALEAMMDRLDELATPSLSDERVDAREPYRMTHVPTIIAYPNGRIGRYSVTTRNICAGGLSFLHGRPAPEGARCQLVLPDANHQLVVLRGTTVYCRPVGGSVHEVGVQFDERVEVGGFEAHPGDEDEDAAPRRRVSGVALVMSPRSTHGLGSLAAELQASGLFVGHSPTLGEAVDRIKAAAPTVVICETARAPEGRLEIGERIREAGFDGPLIGIDPEADRPRVQLGVFDRLCSSADPGPIVEAIAQLLIERARRRRGGGAGGSSDGGSYARAG